jgi:peptidoglycan/xylan/chitin deacetylase (PgdA/CDA1 family)
VIHPGTRILMYHYVRPADAPVRVGAGSVDLDTFGAQLDHLCRTGTPITWRDVISDHPSAPDGFLLTFDDGHDDHHRYVVPMLLERDLSGVFFVMARDAAEGLTVGHRIHVLLAVMTWQELQAEVEGRLGRSFGTLAELDDLKWQLQREQSMEVGPILSALIRERVGDEVDLARGLHLEPWQLEEMAEAGMTLGGHSRTHPWLDWLPEADVVREVGASRGQLEGLGIETPWPFAYPYGAAPKRAGQVLADAGFAAGFVASGHGRRDRWRLGRVDAETWQP